MRQPLGRTPPLSPSAFIAIILTFAVAIIAMFGIDTAASDWAHHLPPWFIGAFEEITNFGLGGWFLIPSAFVFFCKLEADGDRIQGDIARHSALS